MNRQERRRLGKRRAFGIAGVSLAAATGLFGSYLGNPRLPRAYASPTCAPGSGSATFDVANQTQFKAAISTMNAGFVDNSCFTVNVTADFVIDEDLRNTARIEPSTQPVNDVQVAIIGNGHTVSGDPNVAQTSFLGINFWNTSSSDNLRPEVTVSDITLSGFRGTASYGSVLYVNTEVRRGPSRITLDRVTVRDNDFQTSSNYWRGPVAIYGAYLTVRDSAFTNNSLTGSGAFVRGQALNLYARAIAATGVTDAHSAVINTRFDGNTVTATTQGAKATGAALGIYDATRNYTGFMAPATVTGSTFTNNIAEATGGGLASGAAIRLANSITEVSDSVFTNNIARSNGEAQGGAIWVERRWADPSLTVTASEFTGNQAIAGSGRADGGAIMSKTTAAGTTIDSSTFSGNAASSTSGNSFGGAVRLYATTSNQSLAVVNSTVTGNSSTAAAGTASGGGVSTEGAPATVDFSTITENRLVGNITEGGGVWGPVVTLRNSLVNRNTAATGSDVASYSLTAENSLFTSNSALHVIAGGTPAVTDVVYSAEAQVEALADNGGTAIGPTGATQVIRTMALKAGALAIDAGSASVGAQPSFDQRGTGFPRVLDGVPDLGAVEGVSAPTPPPPPPPVFPASAPRDVTGVAGDGSVAVSWLPPETSGSFPVTDYRVTAGPGGASCLAKAPALTCTVTGLTNGTAYTFVVTALNGAGWGQSSVASAPVTPSPTCTPALTLAKGTRQPDGRHDRIRTGGTSACLAEGTRLTPWIRYGDTGEFKEGVASIVVGPQGAYRWTREIRKDKKFVAYVAYEDLESNRVVWTRVR